MSHEHALEGLESSDTEVFEETDDNSNKIWFVSFFFFVCVVDNVVYMDAVNNSTVMECAVCNNNNEHVLV